MKHPQLFTPLLLWLAVGACGVCSAQAPSAGASAGAEPTDLGLEALLGLEVTSAGKKSQRLADTAAAVFVITQDDIRRSGATSIPEVLRMVPGLEVARMNNNTWNISARGFNTRWSTKLLVLMDGRSVYSPVSSGVNWQEQDTMLPDIERIEVIRGPGATLYGANAVNGVINIITKSARSTEGGLAYVAAGNQETLAGVRYGGKLGEDTYYRAYLKHDGFGAFRDATGAVAQDDWRRARTGFRADSRLANGDGVTLQGDLFQSRLNEIFDMPILTPPFLLTATDRARTSAGNLLGRWRRTFSSTSEAALQVYYDQSETSDISGDVGYKTIDVDFQHRFAANQRHDIVWGGGYRYTRDDVTGGLTMSVLPQRGQYSMYNLFVQDEIALIPERLRLTLGSKFEHGSLSGTDIQPSARLQWTPAAAHSLWGSIAKAVRTPSRLDLEARYNSTTFPGRLPTMIAVIGTPAAGSEELIAHEIGYRFQQTKNFSLDATAFYNRYLKLRSTETGAAFVEAQPAPLHLVLPLYFDRKLGGHTAGVEMAAEWRPYSWWRWYATYTFLSADDIHAIDGGNSAPYKFGYGGSSPRNQFYLRSSFDIGDRTELDVWMKRVGQLSAIAIPAYTSFNLRLGWKVQKNLELSLVGQNLLGPQHAEFVTDDGTSRATYIPRSVYAQAMLRF